MKSFKMKRQEVKRWLEKHFWMLKRNFKHFVIKLEAKFGLATRCSFCEENIFCENYDCLSKKRIFHVKRCTDKISTK